MVNGMKISYNTPAEFGELVGITDRAYARLAIMACDHAARGWIESADTKDFLVEFNVARRRAEGSSRAADEPSPQQVSKLRKAVDCGAIYKEEGTKLLELTSEVYLRELMAKQKYEGTVVSKGEYNALVEVARKAIQMGKILSRQQIIKYLTGEEV